MKTRILWLLLCVFVCISAFGQQEPKFVKDVAVLNEDGTLRLLSPSFGKVLPTMTLIVKGPKADNRISQTDTLKLIVKVDNNSFSPNDVIHIYKLHSHTNNRTAFRGGSIISSNDYVSFTGDTYGKSSYIISLVNLEMGEYGVEYNRDSVEGALLGEHVMTFFGIDR